MASVIRMATRAAASTTLSSDHALKREKSKPLSLWVEKQECLQWLDQQSLESVIYVSFGSNMRFSEIQVEELALAPEATQRPFLWVVRPDLIDNRSNKEFPREYFERFGNRGCIISWASQLAVLLHPSVGCFISHCGWN